MSAAALPEDEFIELYLTKGPTYIAETYRLNVRQVNRRRANIAKRLGRPILAPQARIQQRKASITAMLRTELKNGTVIIGSDPHYWPNDIPTAHVAMVEVIRELKPKIVIMDGDVTDGASISRHPPIGWESMPTLQEELETCQTRLREIERAAPKAELYWPAGNHDLRFETRLSTRVPEAKGVQGTSLHHHFSKRWKHCWAVKINDDLIVKHRFKGGVHAAYNNALHSGLNICTGHLHKGVVRAFTDYTGTRWGVDMPTIAEPYGPQFQDYTELNPVDWRSGFTILTLKDGKLLQPEMAFTVGEGVYEFRGEHRTVDVENL